MDTAIVPCFLHSLLSRRIPFDGHSTHFAIPKFSLCNRMKEHQTLMITLHTEAKQLRGFIQANECFLFCNRNLLLGCLDLFQHRQ